MVSTNLYNLYPNENTESKNGKSFDKNDSKLSKVKGTILDFYW